MNTISQLSSRTQSGVDAGSLTAHWLLWGLPESLGLAALHSGEANEGLGEMAGPPQHTS